jgi:hypothetical protein
MILIVACLPYSRKSRKWATKIRQLGVYNELYHSYFGQLEHSETLQHLTIRLSLQRENMPR